MMRASPVGRLLPASILCLGVACASASAASRSVDPDKAAGAGATHMVESLGKVGIMALALFASPTPRRESALAMALAPMFALGGGGLEMNGVWW